MKKLAKGFSLVELMIVVAIIGILSAVAIPNFMKFQAKSRQSEVKLNLKGYHTNMRTAYAEKNKYPVAAAAEKILRLDGQNIYDYNFGISGGNHQILAAGSTAAVSCAVSVAPVAANDDAGTFVGVGCGNIDTDTFIDSWSINSHGCLVPNALDGSETGATCSAKDNDSGNDVIQD